jgi:hypothetical protein
MSIITRGLGLLQKLLTWGYGAAGTPTPPKTSGHGGRGRQVSLTRQSIIRESYKFTAKADILYKEQTSFSMIAAVYHNLSFNMGASAAVLFNELVSITAKAVLSYRKVESFDIVGKYSHKRLLTYLEGL